MLANGEETYYAAGWLYTVVRYSFTLPSTTRGGIIETPSPEPDPAYFSTDIGWLRKADQLESSGPINSMWRLTQSWMGCNAAYWDPNLYS